MSNNPYGSTYYSHTQAASPAVPLQFYAPTPGIDQASFYQSSRPSLDGNVGAQGSISQHGITPNYGGNIQVAGGWWTAFGSGGFEGEPPLLEGDYIRFDGYTVLWCPTCI